ncbi:hypothetical protein LPJ53_001982 [Coemansia erecta]|uniref:ubiquitinyl hydrolase 1 n=1 Tax=Coemansia erecta TaxID=147472 RepID=A0A9W8CTI0_9FUNG|nr:hypothetical protein LPJ53_001982 [Coemansia erecta]
MSNDSSDDGRKGSSSSGRVLGRGRSIRRTILGERTPGTSQTSSPRSSLHITRSPAVAEETGGSQVRTLSEILRPTRDPQDSSQAAAGEEHSWRLSRHHARRMLRRLAAGHSAAASLTTLHRGQLFGGRRADEYPQSDGPSTGLGAIERRRTLDLVHRRGKQLARALGTHKLRRLETAMFLSRAQWDASAGLRMVQAVLCARDGILYDLDVSAGLRGMVNSHGTTCYIDSVVVALFGAQQSCDALLHLRDLGSAEANHLQAVCRLAVNVLRGGDVVDAALVEELRAALVQCGWLAGCPGRRLGQQDAGELYLFLVDALRMPFLPLGVRMEHGADRDAGDSRVATQRMLELSFPSAPSASAAASAEDEAGGALLLQALLEQYFFDNRVEQLERRLAAASVRTNAWSILSILPFYTPQSEAGLGLAEYPDDAPLIVPLLIKRYAVDAQGSAKRVGRRVITPLVLDVTKIVSSEGPGSAAAAAGDSKDGRADGAPRESHRRGADAVQLQGQQPPPPPPPYPEHVQYRLVLRAAVCHKGASAGSGHYVAFATRLRPARADEAAGPAERRAQVALGGGSGGGSGRARAGSANPLALGAGGDRAGLHRRRHSWPPFEALQPPGSDNAAWPAGPPPVSQPASHSDVCGSADDWAQCALSMDLRRHHASADADPPAYTQHPAAQPATVGEFLRFDDLDTAHDRVQRFSAGDGVRGCLDEISRDGYLLFYALQKVELPVEGLPAAAAAAAADSAADGQMHELTSALRWDVDEASARRAVGRMLGDCAADAKDRGGFEDMAMRWQNIRADRLASPVGPLAPSDRPEGSGRHHGHHHGSHGRSHGNRASGAEQCVVM